MYLGGERQLLNRRQFILRSLAVGLGMAGGLSGYAYAVEPAWLRLERVEIPIPSLPPHLDGFRIGVLADLHLGPFVPVERGVRAAELVAREHPDLVLVAGDMTAVDDADLSQWLIDEALAPVAGAYGVLGNWDYYHYPLPAGVAPQKRIRLLVNQGVSPVPGLWLAGLDEGLFGNPNIERALAGAPPDSLRLVLAHEPDLADMIRPGHKVALQISGHTHGGQVRLPLVGPLFTPRMGRKYVAGLYRAPSCLVYTSRGIGMSQLPVRLFCPPEVTLITLRRA